MQTQKSPTSQGEGTTGPSQPTRGASQQSRERQRRAGTTMMMTQTTTFLSKEAREPKEESKDSRVLSATKAPRVTSPRMVERAQLRGPRARLAKEEQRASEGTVQHPQKLEPREAKELVQKQELREARVEPRVRDLTLQFQVKEARQLKERRERLVEREQSKCWMTATMTEAEVSPRRAEREAMRGRRVPRRSPLRTRAREQGKQPKMTTPRALGAIKRAGLREAQMTSKEPWPEASHKARHSIKTPKVLQ